MTLHGEAVSCTTPDGWRLGGELLLPPSPKAGAVLAHAMMATRKTMDRPAGGGLASTLAEMGIAVLSFDLRGHGESGPTAREGASYPYDAFPQRDLPTMVGFARTAFAGMKIAVVGHSLGAHAGLFAAGLHPSAAPDGVVSIAGNLWLPSLEPSALRRAAKRGVYAGWLAMARVQGYFDPRLLGLGTAAEPLEYVEQLVGAYEKDRLLSADGTVDYMAALSKVKIPVLSVSSEGDRLMAHPAAVERFIAGIERGLVTSRVVRAGEAGEKPPGHMGLVMSPGAKGVWAEIGEWVLGLGR